MVTIEEVIKKASAYTTVNKKRLLEAYRFAERAHAGQTRMSGEPYITHPLEVAEILTEYRADENSLITALLHDVVEDTDYGESEIEKRFGKTVKKMVIALTKLPHTFTNSQSGSDFNSKIESIRKIFEVMQEDVRVLVIKLCDRLHNMKTLNHFRTEKQKRISQETLDIYIKIADRLSMYDLKEKLEALCFRFLYPEEHERIIRQLEEEKERFVRQKRKLLEKVKEGKVLQKAEDVIIRRQIPYAELFEKPEAKVSIPIHVYVTVKNTHECFLALENIHELWKNLRGEIRDYITLPKSNGFQALQTSVIRRDGSVLKFIISTPEMYEYSRYGVILDCFKTDNEGKKIHLPWIENLKQIHQKTKEKSTDYMTALQNDILQGSIIIYTDEGKNLFLPIRSTALDAAFYHLGSKAYRVSEILVDQEPVLFSHHLREGERVSFVLSKVENVNYKWLRYVQTTYARSFIYERLKAFRTEKKEGIAREMLQYGLDERGFGYLDEISDVRKAHVAESLESQNWKEVLQSITDGVLDTENVLALLFEKHEDATKLYDAEIVIKRRNGDESINRIFNHFKENKVDFTHLSTKKYDHFYIDHFKVRWSINKKNVIYAYFKEFLHFNISELQPIQRTYIPYLYLLGIPVLWSLNTFVSRYVMSQGLSVENTTELRFLSSAVILYILATLKRVYFHEQHSSFRFPVLFFFITLVLTVYSYLINLSLFHTESIHYIIPVSVSFVIIALVHAFKAVHLTGKNKMVFVKIFAALGLSVLGLVLLMQQPLTQSQTYGISISFAVLVLHMIYNYFGNRYHKKYKVRSRSIMLLSYSFIFASIIFLPFVNLANFQEVSLQTIAIAVINGVFTGGIAHFFFFETSKYLQHYKLTLAMSFMVLLTYVLGAFLEGSSNIYNLLASAFIVLSFFVAARFEYKKQGIYEDIQHLV